MSIYYKIISPAGKINYLFGTIHSNRPEYVVLPVEVKKALDEATTCLFEADTNEGATIGNLVSKKLISQQQQYLNQVSENDFPIANLWLEPSMNAAPFSVAAGIMGMEEPIDPSEFVDVLDSQLQNYARNKNKRLAFLASMEDMADSLFGFNLNLLEKIQFYYFMKSERARSGKFMNGSDSRKAYQQQDIDALKDSLNPFPPASDIPEPVLRYYDGLGVGRDYKMAEAMKPHLNRGGAFVAVGAGHLKEIINKLQSDNYTVEAIPLGKRYYPIDGVLEDGEKIAAFRKIYTALYSAQTSFFKKRGFIPDEEMTVSLTQVRDYTRQNTNSRSAKAWELAEMHYKNISSSNTELLKVICREGYAKSSLFGLFKRTQTNLDDARSIAEASSDTRTGAVREILNGPSI